MRCRAVTVLQKRKLGLLNFTAATGMDADAALLLYLIAAADPQDAVSRYAPNHVLAQAQLLQCFKLTHVSKARQC